MRQSLLALSVFAAASVMPASATESGADPVAAYRAVLQAQYAARQPSVPARPDEAQKIYDYYLQSLGQPGKSRSDTGNMTTQPH
jgi:hypothetical protein